MAQDQSTVETPQAAGDLKRKIIRGSIILGVLVVVAVGVIATVPGLGGVRTAIGNASPGWILAACGIQLVALVAAVVFIQAVFEELPRRLSWWQGWGMEGANAVLPTAGSTGVSYWSVSAVGWAIYRFLERTAVMVIAPAVPNLALIIVFGAGMGLGAFAGPSNWWLTWLPAAVCLLVMVGAVVVAVLAGRLSRRVTNKRLAQGINLIATGVTGTVAILRRRSWRVLGTWVEVLGSISTLWACLIAVGEHLPFAIVAMGFLIGQFAQVIPIPGGIGALDAGMTGALVVYSAPATVSSAGVLIAHGVALVLPIITGAIAFIFLPREIKKTRERNAHATQADAPA